MKHLLLLGFCLCHLWSLGQVCTHETEADQILRIQEILDNSGTSEEQNGFNSVPVQFHFFYKTDSTGGYTVGLGDSIVNRLNDNFFNSNLHFYQCVAPAHLYNDEFYEYTTNEFGDLLWESFNSNTLNIYLFGSVNNGALCGVYQGTHSVMVAYPCSGNASSISHEIGHYLGLPHTFGPTSSTAELADGSNCETAGDAICDTPADPNRLELVDSDCFYHGTVEDELGYPDTVRDANGDAYDPDVRNIMSYYGVFGCRDRFSPMQGLIMNAEVDPYFSNRYLCSDLVVDFSIIQGAVSCDNTLEIELLANTTDPTKVYMWDIDDDGHVDYTTPSVSHRYDQPGKYTISLEVFHPDHQISTHRTKYEAVQITDSNIKAPFIIDFEEGLDQEYINANNTGTFSWAGVTLINGNDVANNVSEPNMTDMLTINVDLTMIEKPILEFKYAYHNGFTPGDTLQVEVFDCQNGYTTVFEKGGDSLNTLSTNNQPKDDGDWEVASIDISEITSDETRLRFSFKGDASGYFTIYLDDILIRESETTSVHHPIDNNLQIFPNPVKDLLSIHSNERISSYRIHDVTGTLVRTGEYSGPIDLGDFNTGIFVLSAQTTNGATETLRFIKI